MIQLKDEELTRLCANGEMTSSQILAMMQEFRADQKDPNVTIWLTSGILLNTERAVGFLLCYQLIKNQIVTNEVADLESLITKEAGSK